MAFQVAELSIELIEVLAPLMPRIKQRDKSLADQLSRAASSIALNLSEAQLSDPGNRKARLFSAAGTQMRRSRGCASLWLGGICRRKTRRRRWRWCGGLWRYFGG